MSSLPWTKRPSNWPWTCMETMWSKLSWWSSKHRTTQRTKTTRAVTRQVFTPSSSSMLAWKTASKSVCTSTDAASCKDALRKEQGPKSWSLLTTSSSTWTTLSKTLTATTLSKTCWSLRTRRRTSRSSNRLPKISLDSPSLSSLPTSLRNVLTQKWTLGLRRSSTSTRYSKVLSHRTTSRSCKSLGLTPRNLRTWRLEYISSCKVWSTTSLVITSSRRRLLWSATSRWEKRF